MSELHSVTDNGDVCAFLHDLSLSKRNHVVFCGNHLFSDSVQHFGFKEEGRVVRADTRKEQPFSLDGRAGNHDDETGRVRKVSLGRLRVVQSAVPNCPIRRPDRQLAAIELITRSVSEFGGLVHYLVEGWENVVSKLHLGDGGSPGSGSSNRKSSDALLGQGRVEDAISAVLFVEAHRTAENTTKFDIFTEKQGALVCFHRDIQSLNDSGPKVQLFEVLRVFETKIFHVEFV